MWWAGSRGAPAIDVFVGAATVGVARADGSAHWQRLTTQADAVPALLAAVQQQGAARGCTLNVWLSGALARPFIAGPLPGVRRMHEVRAVLAAMATEATGLDCPCRVWFDGPVHRGVCMVVAASSTVLDALQRDAAAAAMTIRSMRPWWSAAFNAGLDQAQEAKLMVMDDGEALTLLQGDGGIFSNASTQWPSPEKHQREAWLARQLTGRNVAPVEACILQIADSTGLSGEQPGAQRLAAVPFGALAGAAVAPTRAVVSAAG